MLVALWDYVSIDALSLKSQIGHNRWIFYDDVTLMGYFAMKNVRSEIFINGRRS